MENPTHLLNLAADNIRTLAVSMVERAKSDTLVVPWAVLILSMSSLANF